MSVDLLRNQTRNPARSVNRRPNIIEVVHAMNALLTKKQIHTVCSRTFTGRSKIEVLRYIVKRGILAIEADKRIADARMTALEAEIEAELRSTRQ